MQDVGLTNSLGARTLEFGIYRDGDNNLDESQAVVLRQALDVSAKDSRVAFTVQDTTSRFSDELRTNRYQIVDGAVSDAHVDAPHDMASEQNLAQFVDGVLDNAQRDGAKQTWIDLVDHGGGDGGGLQTSDGQVMSMPDIAQAIADGVAIHAKEHPEDAQRGVDGVVANQCLMDTLGFADALSHAGVKYLAASPETMLSPGVPSTVAHDVAAHEGSPKAMARSVVNDAMRERYGDPFGDTFAPAAAFDVLDLSHDKVSAMTDRVKAFNDAAVVEARNTSVRAALRDDVRGVDGMVRFPESKGLPWHADRPAIATYNAIANDGRLSDGLRAKAAAASDAVANLVLAHKESRGFAPFGGADYSDAVGPTAHLPTSPKQVDPWAPHGITETSNSFYAETDAAALVRVLA